MFSMCQGLFAAFTNLILKQPRVVGQIISPILEMVKLNHREVKWTIQRLNPVNIIVFCQKIPKVPGCHLFLTPVLYFPLHFIHWVFILIIWKCSSFCLEKNKQTNKILQNTSSLWFYTIKLSTIYGRYHMAKG